MFRTLMIALLVFVGSPLFASLQIMSPGASTPILSNNDFKTQLSTSWSLVSIITAADIKVVGTGVLQFYVHASESGFTNTFTAGSATFTEFSDVAWNAAGTLFGTVSVANGDTLGGTLSAIFTTSAAYPSGIPAPIGNTGFGIFLKAGDTHDSNRLFFGYDDNGAGPDDNHDDLIVSAKFVGEEPPLSGTPPVPEPLSAVVWGGIIGIVLLIPAVSRQR